jgi:N-acetylglutamate synthase/N-acetylornithine aminotransferase
MQVSVKIDLYSADEVMLYAKFTTDLEALRDAERAEQMAQYEAEEAKARPTFAVMREAAGIPTQELPATVFTPEQADAVTGEEVAQIAEKMNEAVAPKRQRKRAVQADVPTQTEGASPAPAPAADIKVSDLAKACAAAGRKLGSTEKVLALLTDTYGVKGVADLPADKRQAFLDELKAVAA